MLNKLRARNFRSYKTTELNFSPGVNVIIGPSDSGKTNILRLLKWIFDNRPLGTDIKSWWGGTTLGILYVDDHIIKRERGKENFYQLDTSDPFKAVGKEVPEKITEILNIGDVNVQWQMDGPFLLNSTPGEVGKYINEVVDLEIIYRTLANVDKRLRSTTRELNTEEENFKNLNKEYKTYNWIDNANEELDELEHLDLNILNTEIELKDLNNLIIDIEELDEQISYYKKTTNLKEEYNELQSLNDHILNSEKELKDLKDLIIEIEELDNSIRYYKQKGETLKQELNELKKEKREEQTVINIEVTKELATQAVEELSKINPTINIDKDDMEKVFESWKDMLDDLEYCPLCGQEIQ